MKRQNNSSFAAVALCAVFGALILFTASTGRAVTFATNYFASMTFTDSQMADHPMSIAYDGTNYWVAYGGTASVTNLAQYDASGNLLNKYEPGLDFRSLFTDSSGTLYARAFNSSAILRQTSPGVFATAVSLTGGSLNSQSSVVLNGAGTEYIAMSSGVVSCWSTNGSFIGTVTLSGYGSVPGENVYPPNRGIAALGNYWLTYNGTNVLSAWNSAGQRVAQSTLTGAGTTFDSAFSFSRCNGMVFVADNNSGGLWRGYNVGGGAKVAVYGAPATASWNTDVANKILAVGSISGVDTFYVGTGNPVPALSDLQRYQAVLVYSDAYFNNNTNLGNVLADYIDAGGGVVLCTFAFWDSQGLSIQGRIKTGGYLPFTTASQTTGSGLTLAADVPSHPILNGVSSFNGGTSSYHNWSISITNGATLVAHWSDGQPLVGARAFASGSIVGLNFYPPSSDARSDFWVSSTDGGKLMANALLWSGHIPPVITTNPVSQVVEVGSTVTLSVGAIGSPTLAYQWLNQGTNIPGATGPTYTFAAQLGSAGSYSVVVTNPYGVAYSTTATLTVTGQGALNAADTGWYDSTGYHSPSNPNYVAGQQVGNPLWNDFFVFSVPVLNAPLVAAELQVNTYGVASPTNNVIYQLQDVTTPIATLVAGGTGLTNIYDDLGSGTVYGDRTIRTNDSYRFISIPLNQSLRTAVAAASGGQFAMGGSVINLDGDTNDNIYAFGYSSGLPTDVQLVLTEGTGQAPTAGYFTDNNPSSTGPNAPILAAGFTPLYIGDISTQSFAGLRILVINESANGSLSSALQNRLSDIQAWVSAGGRLVVHDRSAGLNNPNPFLFGLANSNTVRFMTADLNDIPPVDTLVTAGPFGVVGDTTLDGGSSSAHGYVPASGLPPGSRAIIDNTTDVTKVACFSFPLGAGYVYYSTIPLDYYLSDGGGGATTLGTNCQTIYFPNVLWYVHKLVSPLRFLEPASSGVNLPLYLQSADGSPLDTVRASGIKLYATTNIALSFTNWTLLSNPQVLTNGLLRIDGLTYTSPPACFFRAVESQ